ncbi:MAG TPA: NAD(P)/FAD-dependent oxidoreductase [Kofleriaceae bacterium]|nr:NAD(P)/FAD-dependent oxidoreductase [Kofleriaceae bacterium]
MDFPVVIVGAGFSGLAAGILLKKAGVDSFTIVEKLPGVGGTWRANTYPGAACDVQSHLYSFSFEPNPRWSRSYGPQQEILAYLERCAEKYGLTPHCRFDTAVTGADFDEARGLWTVHTTGGDLPARALVLGNGALHLPAYPEIEGLREFKGPVFHSAQWDHSFDPAHKKIGVIGTGASAIQFVPQIAPASKTTHVFQRTPPWIMPKPDRPMKRAERWAMEHIPGAHWARRTGLYWRLESRAYPLIHDAPRISAFAENIAKKFIAEQIADPALRAKVTPDYRLGCKRVLLSNDWYPTLARANVELVTDGIERIEASGIRTKDGALREVDAIILGTGFRVADYLSPVRIVGRGGRELNDVWRDQLATYLGITVAGFPNLFLLMGPGTGLGHNSMIFMIEAQARYAAQSIAALARSGVAYMDVRPEAQAAFTDELERKNSQTVWASGCSSWYRTPNGGLVTWPGFTFDYWRRTRRVDWSDYELRAPQPVVASIHEAGPRDRDRARRAQRV